jgi:hypothetical protein
MKKLITLLIISFIAYNSSTTLHAYSWPIKNLTDKSLIVQVELMASSNPYFAFAQPGQTVKFDWPVGNWYAGFTLNKIKYVIVDDYLLQNADFLNKDKNAIVDNTKTFKWLTKIGNQQKYLPRQAQLVKRHLDSNGNPGKMCILGDGELNYSSPVSLVERQQDGNTIINAEIFTKSLQDLWCVKGIPTEAPSKQKSVPGIPANN